MITRRGLLRGMASLLAAPAIVRASSLMPISVPEPEPFMTLARYAELILAPAVQGRAVDELRYLEGMMQELVCETFYGGSASMELPFTGFATLQGIGAALDAKRLAKVMDEAINPPLLLSTMR